jgi:hypothetical protein
VTPPVSHAATVYVYEVEGIRPRSANVVPALKPTHVPFWKILYPAIVPPGSEEPAQDKSISVLEAAVAVRLVGTAIADEFLGTSVRMDVPVCPKLGPAAVTVTACWATMYEGAVYRPAAVIVPMFGLRDQVMVPFEPELMVAVNCRVWRAYTVGSTGLTATATEGTRVICADTVLLLSATLVAVMVRVCCEEIDDGA